MSASLGELREMYARSLEELDPTEVFREHTLKRPSFVCRNLTTRNTFETENVFIFLHSVTTNLLGHSECTDIDRSILYTVIQMALLPNLAHGPPDMRAFITMPVHYTSNYFELLDLIDTTSQFTRLVIWKVCASVANDGGANTFPEFSQGRHLIYTLLRQTAIRNAPDAQEFDEQIEQYVRRPRYVTARLTTYTSSMGWLPLPVKNDGLSAKNKYIHTTDSPSTTTTTNNSSSTTPSEDAAAATTPTPCSLQNLLNDTSDMDFDLIYDDDIDDDDDEGGDEIATIRVSESKKRKASQVSPHQPPRKRQRCNRIVVHLSAPSIARKRVMARKPKRSTVRRFETGEGSQYFRDGTLRDQLTPEDIRFPDQIVYYLKSCGAHLTELGRNVDWDRLSYEHPNSYPFFAFLTPSPDLPSRRSKFAKEHRSMVLLIQKYIMKHDIGRVEHLL